MLKRLSQGWQVQNSAGSYTCLEILHLLSGLQMLRWQEGGLGAYSIGSGLLMKGANSYLRTLPFYLNPTPFPLYLFLTASSTPNLQLILYEILFWQPLEDRLCFISLYIFNT